MKYAATNAWSGLVVGQDGVHHRGLHCAVVEADTRRLIAVCGPADDATSASDATRIAFLLNHQREMAHAMAMPMTEAPRA